MKQLLKAALVLLLAVTWSGEAGAASFTNFIRQVQVPSGVVWDVPVASSGEQNSALPIDTGGARYELWTVLSSPLTNYLLDNRFVGPYAPSAEVVFKSEDPYTEIPRTRADRPFTVEIAIDGLLTNPAAPAAAKSVKLLRHGQSYGAGGTGGNLDRTQATLLTQASIDRNGKQTFTYEVSSVPAADRTKARGEERFSVFALADGTTPESQIASRYIQIWPVADGAIAGISPGQKIRMQLPKLTITLNDLYPNSRTYAQVYRGEARLGVDGTIVPGTSLVLNGSVPESRVLLLDRYDDVFTGDGRWTMELITITPFGTERLSHVTFEIDRTIDLNGTITTME